MLALTRSLKESRTAFLILKPLTGGFSNLGQTPAELGLGMLVFEGRGSQITDNKIVVVVPLSPGRDPEFRCPHR